MQQLTKVEITKHEKKITTEIREGKDSGKKMFKMIEKLCGSTNKRKADQIVYDENKVKIGEEDASEKLVKYWRGIYRKNPNEMAQSWYESQQQQMNQTRNQPTGLMKLQRTSDMEIPRHMWEHFDALDCNVEEENGKCILEFNSLTFPESVIEHMDVLKGKIVMKGKEKMICRKWSPEEVNSATGKIKNGKQPGPDLIKGEIIKWLRDSHLCIDMLTQVLNNVVQSGEISEKWKITP